MASTDSVHVSEKEHRLDATVVADDKSSEDLKPGAEGVTGAGEDSAVGRSREPSPSSQSFASGSKGSTQCAPAATSSGSVPLSMPHPKKFSHVNINKKFLEKTSSASAPPHTLSASPVLRASNANQKLAVPATTSHPRLVTAKLTATPQPSTAGWSRPSSAVSSTAPTPLPAPGQKPVVPPSSSSVVPVPPPGGKVIHPQPRSNQDVLSIKREPSTKPAWGHPKNGTMPSASPVGVQAEFPTAAEVAQGRLSKSNDKKATQDSAAAHKQAVMAELIAEEDTFRGVHLDPNAHHWDEMEEDDDNFLDGVIEFGDGRQYKVQSAETPPRDASTSLASNERADRPVSKEERFADDFDRSWPRSRPGSSQPSSHPRDQRTGAATSPSSASAQSPQESSSRVLFNERSNRLEPYSQQRHGGPSAPSNLNRRGSRSDFPVSPTEPRRDAPPHTHLQGVQLLQKDGAVPHADGPSFSRAPGDRPPISPQDGSRFRDRPPMRRDHPPWHANGPQTYEGARPGPFGAPGRPPRDVPFDDRRRSMGPPATPGDDHRRQLPPHLSMSGPRFPDRDVPFQSPRPAPSATLPSEPPPPPSASSQAGESPVTPASALPTADLEEVRKVAMHTAAERARLRRQQEEEEREKEKERARKKAAEIEERMKAQELEKAREHENSEVETRKAEAQVLGIIEEAVSSASLSDKRPETSSGSGSQRPSMGRAPSSSGITRPSAIQKPPAATPVAHSSAVSDVDTWRRKVQPLANQAPPAQPSAPPLMSSAVIVHTDLNVKDGEDVDVVDFTDLAGLGKLVGSDHAAGPSMPAQASRPSRAVASDFFEPSAAHGPLQPPPPPSSKADEGPWRRRASIVRPPPNLPDKPIASSTDDTQLQLDGAIRPNGVSGRRPSTSQPSAEEHHRRASGHHQNGMFKSPTGPHYREAPMAVLDDAISRIKGALDGMHHQVEEAKEAPKPAKWLPPALRQKSPHELPQPTETFDVTAAEPPISSMPAWNAFVVKTPSARRPVPPLLRAEPPWPRGQRFQRLEVFSMDVLHRHTTVNDLVFNRPRYIQGQLKYFVSIPRLRPIHRPPVDGTPTSPVVNLPTTPPRLRTVDPRDSGPSNWRKGPPPPSAAPWRPALKAATPDSGLDTTSRSPPPEAPSSTLAVGGTADATESPVATLASSTTPKTPIGSEAVFSRVVQPEAPRSQPATVQSMAASEYEGKSKLGLEMLPPLPKAPVLETLPTPAAPVPVEAKLETSMMVNGVSTPPSQPQPTLSSQWSKSPKAFTMKESPSRAPDPEHLKAVWSQTPDKAQNQPVNSLKGIADDLAGVPFSIQDVKSESGETPPPSGPGPWSRMSAYEVTRAFQQVPVPSSSSAAPQRPVAPSMSASASASSSANGNGSALRNPEFSFSPPPMGPPNPRPAYPGYSPMMNHAPSPSVMYSHPSPVPRPMVVNGGAPSPYGQPVWMPGPAPPQMRSPYPAQLVPYPSPGGAMPMYASPMPPGMQNHPLPPPHPQHNAGVQGRPQGMPLVSPIMQPAMPSMYASSPVLVHTQPVMQPGQHYPVPGPGQANRGPMRPPYEQGVPPPPHMAPQMRQPPPNGYNPGPIPSSYARPSW